MIQAEKINYSYRKQEELFSKFNLSLNSGSITGLLGKNGAGKTTLLKLFAGLLHPIHGEIQVNGFMPGERHPDFLSDIYIVPEEFNIPPISINAFIKATAPLYPNFDLQKFQNIIDEFELERKRNLNKMSHGQRKKFLIAYALSTNCKLLLLDEPTNGLDIPTKGLFRKILVSSVTDEQLVIISTHQVKDVENIVDHLVLIDDGNLLFQKDVWKITGKYQFQRLSSVEKIENLVYYEKAPGGYKAILESNNGEETDIDIELLFNAITNQSKINI